VITVIFLLFSLTSLIALIQTVIPAQVLNNNRIEREILLAAMQKLNLTVQDVYNVVCTRLQSGGYDLPTSVHYHPNTNAATTVTVPAASTHVVDASGSSSSATAANSSSTTAASTIQQLIANEYVCKECATEVFRELCYTYREREVQNADLPAFAQNRANCWYGKECRSQTHNEQHARRLNHICENAKKPGNNAGAPNNGGSQN